MKKISLLVLFVAAATMMTGCQQYMCLAPAGTTASSKLDICHATGKKDKFQLITIKASAAGPHIEHGDFLAPVGAKKNSDCKVPVVDDTVVVVPPVVIDTVIVVPPVVVDTVVVVPPVVVDTTTVDSTGSEENDAIKDLPGDIIETVSCLVDPTQPECQL